MNCPSACTDTTPPVGAVTGVTVTLRPSASCVGESSDPPTGCPCSVPRTMLATCGPTAPGSITSTVIVCVTVCPASSCTTIVTRSRPTQPPAGV